MAVCNTVAFGLNKFESYHSHNGESPVGRAPIVIGVENSNPFKADQGFDSLSLRKIFWRVGRVVMHWLAKSRLG